MLKIDYHKSFKKDYRKALKRGIDVNEVNKVINMLANEIPLPAQYKDHALKGNYIGYRECHVQNDWLLVYRIEKNILTLTLAYMGTHSDLF